RNTATSRNRNALQKSSMFHRIPSKFADSEKSSKAALREHYATITIASCFGNSVKDEVGGMKASHLWVFFTEPAARLLSFPLCLCRGFIETGLKVSATVFPSLVDGGFPIVGDDDERWRPVVVMAAKCDNVCLSHSGRENSQEN